MLPEFISFADGGANTVDTFMALLSYEFNYLHGKYTEIQRFLSNLFVQYWLSSKVAISHMCLVSVKYTLDFEDNTNKIM